jgi:hypothetical protein
VAEVLGPKHLSDPRILELCEQSLQSAHAVSFLESRIREWLNFPSEGFATFDEYLAAYSHLVTPAVISPIAFARRTPNTSLERTRGE